MFTGHCRVIVRVGKCEAGEILTTPGTVWRAYCPASKPAPAPTPTPKRGTGMEAEGPTVWQLAAPRSTVSFTVAAGEMRKLTLAFAAPQSTPDGTIVRVSVRKDGKFATGGVSLQMVA